MSRFQAIVVASVLMIGACFGQHQKLESQLHGMLPQAVTSFGAATDGQWLYVLGGAKGRPHHYDVNSQSPAFMRMNLHNLGDWQYLPSTTPLQSVALVRYRDSLIRVGGMRSLNKPGEDQRNESVTEFARFSPAAMKWTSMPPLPAGRSSHDAVVVGDRIFVVGGWRLDPELDDRWASSVWCFDLSNPTGSWEVFCEAPFRRRALAVAHTEGRIFALGGINEDGETSNQVDILDLKSKTWSVGPEFPAHGIKGFGMSAFGDQGRIVASAADGTVRSISLQDKSWQPLGNLMFKRFFHRLIADEKGGFLVLGGSGKEGRIRHIEHLTAANPKSVAPTVATFEIPFEGKAKNRQGMLLKGQNLLFFGGNNSLGQHDFDRDNFVNESWMLDLATMTVTSDSKFPSPRQSMMAVMDGDSKPQRGLAFGGFEFAEGGAKTVSSLHQFDFKSRDWHQLDGAIPNRSQAGFALRPDGLWVFGGLDYDPTRPKNERFQHPKEVVRISLATDAIKSESIGVTMPSERRAFGGAQLGHHYIMVGGMKDGFAAVDTCDVFDFESQSWSTIPAPKYTRLNPQLVALRGKLFLAGGTARMNGKRQPVAEVEMFDPLTQQWTVILEKAPIPTRHMRLFGFQGSLLFVSTHNENSVVQLGFVRPIIPHTKSTSRPHLKK